MARPPGIPFERSLPRPVVQYVRRITAGQGLTIPTFLRSRLGGPGVRLDTLVVLKDPGCVAVHPWHLHKARLLDVRRQLLEEEDDLEALAWFDDRYRLGRVSVGGRLALEDPVLVHLGALPSDRPHVLLIGFPDHFEIWSVAYRETRLRERALEIEGLP